MLKPKLPKKFLDVLNIDKALGQPRNRVALVGIELEGGWRIDQPVVASVVRDGSVLKKADEGGLMREGYPNHRFGEIAVGPIIPAQIESKMRGSWPDHIDITCGLHVHQSFTSPLYYGLLADSPSYQDTMFEYLSRWAKEEGLGPKHPIWDRLSGQNIYCQRKFWPEAQMSRGGPKDHDQERYGHRYTGVHYCLQRWSTIEVRLLPMFDSIDQSIRAVRRVIDITNAYLVKAEKTRVKDVAALPYNPKGSTMIKMEFKNGTLYEEYYED